VLGDKFDCETGALLCNSQWDQELISQKSVYPGGRLHEAQQSIYSLISDMFGWLTFRTQGAETKVSRISSTSDEYGTTFTDRSRMHEIDICPETILGKSFKHTPSLPQGYMLG
jgi:hypothetical protein